MTVSITFDDGLRAQARVAAPALARRGWRGAFNVPTAYLEEATRRLTPATVEDMCLEGNENAFMSWDDVRALLAAGHEVYPHTRTHASLPDIADDAARLEDEIVGAMRDYEDRVGRHPAFFCCPHNDAPSAAVRLIHAHGMAVFNCDRMNFGCENDVELTPYLRERFWLGKRHVDIMIHGVLSAEGGWLPFADAAAFEAFLDELEGLEKSGFIRVVSYAAAHRTHSPVHGLLDAFDGLVDKVRRSLYGDVLYRAARKRAPCGTGELAAALGVTDLRLLYDKSDREGNLIYRAKMDGRPVVVKYSPTFPASIENERDCATAARRVLGAARVPAVCAFSRLRRGAALAMEDLAPARSLHGLLEDGLLSEDAWPAVIAQLSEITEKLRAAGIFHRDFCAQNVLRRADGTLAVIDWQDATVRGAATDTYAAWLATSKLKLAFMMAPAGYGIFTWNDRASFLGDLDTAAAFRAKLAAAWTSDLAAWTYRVPMAWGAWVRFFVLWGVSELRALFGGAHARERRACARLTVRERLGGGRETRE